ncbi:MAG TPA: nickel-binding protein [Xanthomarina sp.]|nr:nickel-binding protein [Xanthomarina sp.]
MPLYLDLHDLPDGVSAKHVAEMHQADLGIEHKYNCRGLTYWCDEKRKTAFCLIEAPNKESVLNLHKNSHGAVPQRIIEVNDTIVESFLGRIEDPEKSQNTHLNIINDPAFRTIMVIKILNNSLKTLHKNTFKTANRNNIKLINSLIINFNGRLVQHTNNSFLVSYASVTDAIHCGIKIKEYHSSVTSPHVKFKIGISAGIPVTEKEGLFEDTIKTSNYLCNIIKGDFTITKAVKDLYEGENQNKPVSENKLIRVLNNTDMEFINHLMAYTENIWSYMTTNVNNFEENLGYSKSKLYRTMMHLVGKSPNIFLRDYRLNKALELLEKQSGNISEIAYQTGFSSPAYFSKCFQKKYGILPSNFY